MTRTVIITIVVTLLVVWAVGAALRAYTHRGHPASSLTFHLEWPLRGIEGPEGAGTFGNGPRAVPDDIRPQLTDPPRLAFAPGITPLPADLGVSL